MELCNLINQAAELANSIELLYSSSSARSPHHLEFYECVSAQRNLLISNRRTLVVQFVSAGSGHLQRPVPIISTFFELLISSCTLNLV